MVLECIMHVSSMDKMLAKSFFLCSHGCMKMTINVDEALLARVVAITESATKTEAIHYALREVDRRARLVEVLREGLGASAEELKDMFDPASDPGVLRAAEARGSYRLQDESGDSTASIDSEK